MAAATTLDFAARLGDRPALVGNAGVWTAVWEEAALGSLRRILSGPPGIGKTEMARALFQSTRAARGTTLLLEPAEGSQEAVSLLLQATERWKKTTTGIPPLILIQAAEVLPPHIQVQIADLLLDIAGQCEDVVNVLIETGDPARITPSLQSACTLTPLRALTEEECRVVAETCIAEQRLPSHSPLPLAYIRDAAARIAGGDARKVRQRISLAALGISLPPSAS